MPKEDSITTKEKYIRDALLSPIAKLIWFFWALPRLLKKIGVSREKTLTFGAANLMSLAGLLLIIKFWAVFKNEGINPQVFWLVLAAFLTDMIDGPIARIHNEITPLGTILDHLRDYLALFSVIIMIFLHFISRPDILIILAAIALGTIILALANAKMFLARHELFKKHHDIWRIIRDFSLEDYQTSFTGRIHFFTAAAGVSGLLFFAAYQKEWVYFLSYVALLLHVAISGFYINELWQNYYKRLAVFERWRSRSQRFKERLQKP